MCEDCGRHGEEHEHLAHSHEQAHEGHAGVHDHNHGHADDAGAHAHDQSHAHDHTHDHEYDHGALDESTVVETGGTTRIAVTGKGGVGKTTLAAALARHLAAHHDVIAVDADPDMNLAGALGVAEPRPVTAESDLIEERAGEKGGLVSLTPEVADLLETHSSDFGPRGRLLTIGSPASGNSGCLCPENSVVRSLVSSALSEEYVVMDMEAGVEHLGRGTAEAVDVMLVVVDPSRAAIETAGRVEDLAGDLGIDEVRAFVNKTRDNGDVVREALDVPVVATLPYDEDVASAALAGESPVAASDRLQAAAADVLAAIRPTRDGE